MTRWKLWLGLSASIGMLSACDTDLPGAEGSDASTSSDDSSTGNSSSVTLTTNATNATVTTMPETATAAESSSTTNDSSTTGSGTTDESTSGSTSTGSSESSSSSTGGDDSCESTSPYGGPGECDPYAQDCPDGFRCVPWADDGGTVWNSTRCSVLDDTPDQLGDLCTVEDSGVSGVDSCDAGLMCFGVDLETNIGECIALCECGPAEQQCAEAGAFCSVSNEGSLPICLSPCDPLVEDSCGDGDGCYPIDNTFVCAPDASGVNGAEGDTCANINACDPGLGCVTPDALVDCPAGSAGCCSTFCALDGVDECLVGSDCVPWFPEGMEPPGLENVGFCGAP